MASDWASYDSAAEWRKSASHRPRGFWISGTGAGLAALGAIEAAGANAVVVGMDHPALAMLRIARTHGVGNVVAGVAPGLPFADRGL